MKIFITGPAGSGKSTQAKKLAEKLNLCYISGGDLAREKTREDSAEGKSVKEALEKGELVDNKIEAEMVNAAAENPGCLKGYVMDGFPRSIDQLKYFTPDFDKVFYLKVSDEEAQKRLSLRGRADDTPDAIAERLQIFHEETKEVLELFESQGILVRINGEQDENSVFAEIEKNLLKEAQA